MAEELARLPKRAGDKPFPPRPRRRGRKSNDVRFDATGPLFQALGVDLTLIDGIDVNTALVMWGELGVDVSRFPTATHFASWRRLSPPVAESTGTRTKRSPRRGKSRLAQAVRLAAQAVRRTKTALAAFSHRIKGRLRGRGALTATAPKLAVLVYRLLTYGADYVRPSLADDAAKVREPTDRRWRRQAAQRGVDLVPQTPPPPEPV